MQIQESPHLRFSLLNPSGFVVEFFSPVSHLVVMHTIKGG